MKLKCALHTHTKGFDKYAELAPQEAIAMYKNQGFDVIAITDHNHLYDGPTNHDGILVIPGNEITGQKYHILEFGGIRILAHPSWSGLTQAEFDRQMETCDAFEAFNGTCRSKGVEWNPEKYAMWPGHGIATDDLHWVRRDVGNVGMVNYFAVGVTYVDAEAATIESVCAAIKAGKYTVDK